VQELSRGAGHSARRSALALTAGSGSGRSPPPSWRSGRVTHCCLPSLPYLVIGIATAVTAWPAPEGSRHPMAPHAPGRHQRERNPTAQGSSQVRGWPPGGGAHGAVLAGRRACQPDGVRVDVAGHPRAARGDRQRADLVRRIRGPDHGTGVRGRSRGPAGRPAGQQPARGRRRRPVLRGGRRGAWRRRGGRRCPWPGGCLGGSFLAWPTGCAWCPGCGRPNRWPGRASAARWSPVTTRWPTWVSRHRTWLTAWARCQARPARSPCWRESRSWSRRGRPGMRSG
jgi:hypothetical protein